MLFSGAREQADLDAVPLPGRESVAPYDTGRTPMRSAWRRSAAAFSTASTASTASSTARRCGCEPPSGSWTRSSPWKRDHGVESFTFVDSVFNIPRQHAEAVCREIVRRGLRVRWSAWFNERRPDPGICRAGAGRGVQEHHPVAGRLLGRDPAQSRQEHPHRGHPRLHELLKGIDGFEVSYNFFKNPPGQTLAGGALAARLRGEAKREMGPRVHFEFNAMRVEPHTRLHAVALEEGVVAAGESLLFPRYYRNPARGTSRRSSISCWRSRARERGPDPAMVVNESFFRDALRLLVWYPLRWLVVALPVRAGIFVLRSMGDLHCALARGRQSLLLENLRRMNLPGGATAADESGRRCGSISGTTTSTGC